MRLLFAFVFFMNGAFAQAPLRNILTDKELPWYSKRMGHYSTSPVEALNTYLTIYKWDEEVEIIPTEVLSYDGKGLAPRSYHRYPDLILSVDRSSESKSIYQRFQPALKLMSAEVNVSKLLPDWAKAVNNTDANNHSPALVKFNSAYGSLMGGDKVEVPMYPNCFGTTQTIFDRKLDFKFIFSQDFQKYLNENFEMVKAGELVQFGDVFTLYFYQGGYCLFCENNWSESLKLIHASMVVNRDYVWGRASSHPDDEWTFEDLATGFQINFDNLIRDYNGRDYALGASPFLNQIRVIFWRKQGA